MLNYVSTCIILANNTYSFSLDMRNLFPSEKPLLWVIFFSKSLLNGWNHVKKNISKDSSYQIYFTEIGSWICNLKELTQRAKRLPLSAVKVMVSFYIRCDRCILLTFLPSDTVQNYLYETCDRENAEIVGLLGRRSLSPRVSPSLSLVLSCAHCVLPGACYGG